MPFHATRIIAIPRAGLVAAALAGASLLSGCMQPGPGLGGAAPRAGLASERVAVTGDAEVIPAVVRQPEHAPSPTPSTIRQPDPTCEYERLPDRAGSDHRIALYLITPPGVRAGLSGLTGSYTIFHRDSVRSPWAVPTTSDMYSHGSFTIRSFELDSTRGSEHLIGTRVTEDLLDRHLVDAFVYLGAGSDSINCTER